MANAKWTIIVFINGENNLMDHAITTYNDLAMIGSTQDINIIVFIDFPTFYIEKSIQGSPYEFLKDKEKWKPALYLVQKGIQIETARPFYVRSDEFRPDNLYDSRYLTHFIQKAVSDYPADHYGFSYKSHGGQHTDITSKFVEYCQVKLREEEITTFSSNRYFIKSLNLKTRIDKEVIPHAEGAWVMNTTDGAFVVERNEETNKPEQIIVTFTGTNSKNLSFKKFSDSVFKGFNQNKISILILDGCWGMSMEMANIFKEVCDYYIASNDETPAKGIGYDRLLQALISNPDIRPEEAARMVTSTFFQKRYDDYINYDDREDRTFFHYGVSLTSINCLRFEVLKVLFKRFCSILLFLFADSEKLPTAKKILNKSRNKCKDFTYQQNADYYAMYNIDLVWLLENIIYYSKNHVSEPVFLNLQTICYELIVEIRLYLIECFVSNNYTKANLDLDQEQLESKGISITFPATEENFQKSIYFNVEAANFSFGDETGWTKVLEKYYS